ncbi:uncharacterized protein [Cardiocondyla obscurior]|uniref:uncharacterized protein n=1 Tax=Cardiocondyla obscurior TaxID=286306 RepID=UPI0039658AA9
MSYQLRTPCRLGIRHLTAFLNFKICGHIGTWQRVLHFDLFGRGAHTIMIELYLQIMQSLEKFEDELLKMNTEITSNNSAMSLENLEDELIKTNPEEMLSTNELIDSIQLYDATVEIIGFVDGIDSPKIVGSNQQFKIFKFYISNGMGRRVQVVCWNDEIEKISEKILPNCIIHLDGVQARVPKIAAFNNGNVPFELLIRSNSIITNLGKYEPTTNFIENPITIKFTEIFNTTQRISM